MQELVSLNTQLNLGKIKHGIWQREY